MTAFDRPRTEQELTGSRGAGADNDEPVAREPARRERPVVRGNFVPATATISSGTVELKADGVATPVSARYGWHETAQPNLINRAGWPALP